MPKAHDRAAASRVSVFVLGTAQDGGVPHVGCVRVCCKTARKHGLQRHPACLGVVDRAANQTLLIEASPAIDAQISLLQEASGLEGQGRNPVDAVLLTHAHIGHYAGLLQLGREVAATSRLPVWVSARMADFLRANGPWKQLVELEQIELRVFTPGMPFRPLPGLDVEAIPVPHRDEYSDTMAFRLRGENRALLFVPDINRWSASSKTQSRDLLAELLEGVDVAYLDGTFWDGSEVPGRNLREIPHPTMKETMQRLASRARAQPGALRFIHLNHSNPAWRDPLVEAQVDRQGFALARRGERVDL